MPRNLREEIEQADRKRQQFEADRPQREKREAIARLAKENLVLETGEGLKDKAREYFDKYLMPIFEEVAAAKKISLTTPSESSSFRRSEEVNNHRHYGLRAVVTGVLTWNHKNISYFSYSNQSLTLRVTDSGKVGFSPDDTNLLTESGRSKLLNSVRKIMIEEDGYHTFVDNTPNELAGM